MATEREKMLAGELYDALDPELVALRGHGRQRFPIPLPFRVIHPPIELCKRAKLMAKSIPVRPSALPIDVDERRA